MRCFSLKSGFTIIELVIVVLIIAVLSAIVVSTGLHEHAVSCYILLMTQIREPLMVRLVLLGTHLGPVKANSHRAKSG
jgi:prepilin-type N-terminal cleavage/methylation domain-containing protein